MPVSSQWEYLTVLVSTELLDYEEFHPKSVNGQELENWKKIDLNTFLSQLGAALEEDSRPASEDPW